MADSDKDIVITPNTGAASDPSIVFSSGATGGDDVTLSVTDDGTITTLSIDGSAGQLLAISNDLTGTIFAVNDVSGIPSIEVDADGTIRLAEFDGDVGIGQGTPTHKLHITGPTTANTHTGIFIDSTGDAYLDLRADNTTGGAETNNPYVRFRQDQDAIETVLGHVNNADDARGNAVTGAAANAFVIHDRHVTGTISLAVNGSTGLTVDDNDRVYIGQDRTGYLRSVSGDYGSIQVDGAEGASGTWTGYSIGGRLVFMDNVGSATTNRGGIYDDLNNLWALQYNTGGTGNSELSLYYNGSVKLATTSGGVSITGDMSSTTMQGLGYHASSGDAAPGADVWLRSNTNGYTYLGWINTVSGNTTGTFTRIYTNSSGSDAFVRYCTPAHFASVLDDQSWTFTGTTILDGVVTTADYGTGGRVKDGADIQRPVGFNVMPVVSFSSTLTVALNRNGTCYYHSSATAHTVNVNNDANIPTGATYMFRNWYQPTSTTVASGGTLTFNPGTGVYLWYSSGSGTPIGGTGNRTLAGGGYCTLYKQSDTIWHMWGAGIS